VLLDFRTRLRIEITPVQLDHFKFPKDPLEKDIEEMNIISHTFLLLIDDSHLNW